MPIRISVGKGKKRRTKSKSFGEVKGLIKRRYAKKLGHKISDKKAARITASIEKKQHPKRRKRS